MNNRRDAHTHMPDLEGRRAIVTGGTTGIGRAIAVLLASYGVKVFVCGRDHQHLADALARIGEVGAGDGIALDLTERDGVSRFFEAADRFLGGLDIAIVNAGISADGLMETAVEDIRYVVDTNLTATMVVSRAAAERMEAGGDIVIVGSVSAVSRAPSSTVYVATKAGVQAFAEALRKELAEKDVKVGNVEPGHTGSDMQLPETPPEKQREEIEADKMMRAEDIAVAVLYMLTQPRRVDVSLLRLQQRRTAE